MDIANLVAIFDLAVVDVVDIVVDDVDNVDDFR